jgi:hypothetical protein
MSGAQGNYFLGAAHRAKSVRHLFTLSSNDLKGLIEASVDNDVLLGVESGFLVQEFEKL